jgi:hypothetical protein
VRSEIEASRGRQKKAAPNWPPAPKVEVREDVSIPEGEPPWQPCIWIGGEGPNSSMPKAEWIRCVYMCGKYEVTLYVFGKRAEDCKLPRSLDRAEDAAKREALR